MGRLFYTIRAPDGSAGREVERPAGPPRAAAPSPPRRPAPRAAPRAAARRGSAPRPREAWKSEPAVTRRPSASASRAELLLAPVVVGMEDLDSVEAEVAPPPEELARIAVPDRVGEDREAPGPADRPDRLLESPLRLRDERRAAVAEVSVEGLLDAPDDPLRDEGARHVRPPEGAGSDLRPERREVERHPEPRELLDHRLAAPVPHLAEPREPLDEGRLLRVEEEPQEVNVLSPVVDGELRAPGRDETRPRGRRLERRRRRGRRRDRSGRRRRGRPPRARRTSSAGDSTPSEKVEWKWRSAPPNGITFERA